MTQYSTTENIIYPPGKLISSVIKVKPSGNIFYEGLSKQQYPLPTLVEAKRNQDGSINVKTLIFLNSTISLTSSMVNVSQLFSISDFGDCKLQFFIHSTKDDIALIKEDKTEYNYLAYVIEFTTNDKTNFPKGISLENIKTVQTFLWDIDPKTSRGTETTVQDTTPD
ncbi:hypothetical protein [uncultured Tenacibaculum sp.]|uniref:hypothetical protein n=1 Tax=uncultured Tenacibaculum sp. TaxID=174713 RepID=UPI00262383A0|nr:hypothetical protein [uncultured Tenacibaculum sp.]